jgi:sugar lactone lactonase YvrE
MSQKIFFQQNKCSAWYLGKYCWAYDNVSANLGASNTDLRFSSDGTKFYVIRNTNLIYQYSLSTAWNLSGVTFVQSNDFGTVTDSVWINGIDFSEDGTKLFFVRRMSSGSTQYSRIYRYNLSTAWDISTASAAGVSPILFGNFADGLVIANSGTKAYTNVTNDGLFYQHSMSTAYDVTTITYDGKSLDRGGARGMYMSPNGEYLYTDNLRQYNLATPYDISTGVYIDNSSPAILQDNNGGIHFKSDGRRFFTVSVTSNFIYQYSKK